MHASTFFQGLVAFTLLSRPALAQNTTTPVLTHAFTVHVSVGMPVDPIPVGGDLTLVEPLTGGTIAGPLFNGKIASGGAAVIGLNTNATIANPSIEIWGTADDGSPFFVQASGVGKPGSQFARVIVEIGGKYAKLANEFILATFTDNDANPPTASTIEAWVVGRGA